MQQQTFWIRLTDIKLITLILWYVNNDGEDDDDDVGAVAVAVAFAVTVAVVGCLV